MADTKISALPAVTTPAGTDIYVTVQGGSTKQIIFSSMLRGLPDGSAASPAFAFASDPDTGIYSVGANSIGIATGGTLRATFNSSGNVGVAATLKAWPTAYTAMQIGGEVALWGTKNPAAGNVLFLTNNVYYDGAFKYIFNDEASAYQQLDGSHKWYTTAPGAADSAISWTTVMQTDTSGHLTPGTDNTQNFGSGSFRWKEIFAGTGTINTSDGRTKDILPDVLGLEFIKRLNPVCYKFKDEVAPAVTETRMVEKPVTQTVEKQKKDVQLIDGRYVQVTVTETVEEPVCDEFPVYDEMGNLMEGKVVSIPRVKTVEETVEVTPAKNNIYTRPHQGLISQEVKAVLDSLGVDFAGYVSDGDYFGLRYTEFIAPLIKAVQELQAQIDDIKLRIV